MSRSAFATLVLLIVSVAHSAEPAVKRVLLVGQGPDGHPPGTHAFMPGLEVLLRCLERQPGLAVRLVNGDEPWSDGPELLAQCDAVVFYLSQGAQWFRAAPARLAALRELAERKGGLVAIHWAVGAKDAEHIDDCLRLLGGCHGGPDRKYTKTTTELRMAEAALPITRGIRDFTVYDEFYYQLKFVSPSGSVQPVLQATLDGNAETVCWAWSRPDGGRSFGFSGAHFHGNWQLREYRRLIVQAVLWSLDAPIPSDGVDVELRPGDWESGWTQP